MMGQVINWNDVYYRFLNSYTKQVLEEACSLFIRSLPYLIIGILLSALIKQYVSSDTLNRFISGKNKVWAILIAAFLGILSPLGSYVVIPLSAALVLAGLPLEPVIAFAVSSPLINPNLFVLTWGALGPEMAIMRCISAFILGVSAGFITQLTLTKHQTGVKGQSKINAAELIVKRPFWKEIERHTVYISKHFTIGILIAALTKVFLPVHLVTNYLGSQHLFSVFLATLAGVPFYSCGGAAIPVVQQLAELGADKGAILAYFIAGPSTKIANLTVMASVFKKGIVGIYLLVSLIGAMLIGSFYHYL